MNIKTNLNSTQIMIACIVLMLIISAILYPSLPEELPRQWGANGEVNSTWHKIYAVLIAPALSIFIWVLTYILPKIDPKRESYEKFDGFYMRFRVALVVFFLGMHIITLTQYDNADMVIRLIMFGAAALLALLGNELGRVRQTWFFGIRTPWTIADERVWKKTHRVGGRWFVALGVFNMLIALILPINVMTVIFIATILLVSFGIMGYSYKVYNQLNG
ncbi:MAG: SdpI family protein [Phototrophicaceae bacterium]